MAEWHTQLTQNNTFGFEIDNDLYVKYNKTELSGNVVELAYTVDSKSIAARIEGSSPSVATHKKCGKCEEWKLFAEFSMKLKSRASSCKKCIASYGKEHYKKNRSKYIERAKINEEVSIKRNRAFVRALKELNPCMDCGIKYPYYVMDFDHRERSTKRADVSDLTKQAFGLETIQEEIDKCDLVCANCHRKRTFQRGMGL